MPESRRPPLAVLPGQAAVDHIGSGLERIKRMGRGEQRREHGGCVRRGGGRGVGARVGRRLRAGGGQEAVGRQVDSVVHLSDGGERREYVVNEGAGMSLSRVAGYCFVLNCSATTIFMYL